MNYSELYQKILQIDNELVIKQIPVSERPIEALNILQPLGGSKSIFTPGTGALINTDLLGSITDWYRNLYGTNKVDRSNFEIGQNPVLIRGEVYYIRHYLSIGNCVVNTSHILRCVEDLTESVAQSLTESELQVVIDEFLLGHNAFTALLPLEDYENISFSTLSKNYINRGIANVHSSVTVLKYTRDSQSVAFPVQQAVETLLKAFLARLEPKLCEKDFKNKFSHRIDDLLKELINRNKAFQEVESLVDQVKVDMNIRYKPMNYTIKSALNAINCMLSICNFISDQWFV
jgi:HEPN domain-containing protein